jgi:hypothetical protein
MKDPGYLTAVSDPEVMASSGPRYNLGLCDTCTTVRPLRSKHCDHCNRCADMKLLSITSGSCMQSVHLVTKHQQQPDWLMESSCLKAGVWRAATIIAR